VGTPTMDTSEITTSGPIIQGMGVCNQTHSRAAASAINKVVPTRHQDLGANVGESKGTGMGKQADKRG
jgi:hypothetical protein